MKLSTSWFAIAIVLAAPAFAEAPAESRYPPSGLQSSTPAKAREMTKDFGTPTFFSSLDSFAMVPRSSGFETLRSSTSALFCSAGSTDSRAVGQLNLPHGVELDLMRMWVFDSSASDDVTVTLQRACLPDFSAAQPDLETLATITSNGSGGAFSQSDFLAAGVVADNQSCTHQVIVQFGNTTGTCADALFFYKARMQWRRQAPPAPLFATFSDVPTGAQFFREVEALADSGVTGGCAPNLFCPEQPVTRRQMAAFLVRALGLPLSTIEDPANP